MITIKLSPAPGRTEADLLRRLQRFQETNGAPLHSGLLASGLKGATIKLSPPDPEPLGLAGCDGEGPHTGREIRALPTGEGNALLCRACYGKEIKFRKESNRDLSGGFDLPSWQSLRIYGRRK